MSNLKCFKKYAVCLSLICLAFVPVLSQQLPRPDHVVVLIMENHTYGQIIGNPNATYINGLVSDGSTAVFSKSYGLAYPSQPNYIMLYSGSNQGVTTNNRPDSLPFTTCNMGASLFQAGYSFVTYSEDLPYAGFDSANYLHYYRKHNPCVNWQNSPQNGVPVSSNLPFTGFPANYDSLPTVCYVVPNQLNDMHDSAWTANCIIRGDNWIRDNLDGYIQWAKTHNSLFIMTFDEDDHSDFNHIPTLFSGEMVAPVMSTDSINHYHILRTIEDMYSLPHCANSDSVQPVLNCWIALTDVKVNSDKLFVLKVADDEMNLTFTKPTGVTNISIVDINGKTVLSEKHIVSSGNYEFNRKISFLNSGVYFIQIEALNKKMVEKFVYTAR